MDQSNSYGQKWERPRRFNDPRALAACVEILDGLIATGSIEEIPPDKDDMEWNTPINMVIDKYVEKDGIKVPVYRMTCDSRHVNGRKEVEPFKTVNVEQIFQNLAGKSHQSIMDLPQGFLVLKYNIR